MSALIPLSVIHLVRKGNPESLLARFVQTYLQNDAGCAHDLIFILKGFNGPNAAAMKSTILKQLPGAGFIEIDDHGYDINAYRIAAERLGTSLLIFTNSYTSLEEGGWARKLLQPFEENAETGVTGATASWESISPTTPFPNPHIRTNAFAVRRDDFLSLDFGPLDTKWACREFEAGENSMTRQFIKRGLHPYVIGKNGVAYAMEDWPQANVFRWDRQSNLLVSDNQTRAYVDAIYYWRRKQSRASWQAKQNPFRTSIAEKIERFFRASTWQQTWRRLMK